MPETPGFSTPVVVELLGIQNSMTGVSEFTQNVIDYLRQKGCAFYGGDIVEQNVIIVMSIIPDELEKIQRLLTLIEYGQHALLYCTLFITPEERTIFRLQKLNPKRPDDFDFDPERPSDFEAEHPAQKLLKPFGSVEEFMALWEDVVDTLNEEFG